MPETLPGSSGAATTPPKTSATLGIAAGGSTFGQRREDIFKRVALSAEQCRLNFGGRKELATEKDDAVAELCEALEDAFSYGLKQQQDKIVMTAASLFQNMQEIMTGGLSSSVPSNGFSASDTSFWDFCQTHLTAHERERYDNLKHVWTKAGRGRAFIRATLNEHSLERYLLTWLSAEDELRRYYTPWSLLLNAEASRALPQIMGSLSEILFALTVDTTELNVVTRVAGGGAVATRVEPIIYAPSPVPVVSAKNRRRQNAVERPIVTASSTEDLLSALREVGVAETASVQSSASAVDSFDAEAQAGSDIEQQPPPPPPDPIEPELEFLKQPLPDFYPENHTILSNGADEDVDKSDDTSSLYSKSSSANCSSSCAATAQQAALEERLREMTERCLLLETRVAQLSLENRQLVRRLTQHFNESGIDPSSSLATNFLITIPHVQLLKARTSKSYYAYEIHITMRRNLEHWVLMRRYREFYKLHKSLLRTHPNVAAVEFPPKKHFGNMNLVFVEERRQQLQIYLLNLVESLPQVEACKTKAELQKVFPFLRER